MKTPCIILAVSAALCGSAITQPPEPSVVPSTAISARDGFTRSSTGVLFTHKGVVQRVEREVVLSSGLRVRPDGSVILANGERADLRNNQLLTLQGRIEDVALTPGGTAPVTSAGPPMKKQGEEVGVSSYDGISAADRETRITRNGVTERMTRELQLSDGTRVLTNGTIVRPNGAQLTLRENQVLTFDGVLREIPFTPNTNPGRPDAQSRE